MQLNKKFLALLIGTSLACIPFMSKAAFNVGDHFFIGTHEYVILANQEFNDGSEGAYSDWLEENEGEPYVQAHGGVPGYPNYDVEVIEVPFDAGISILLGAGAIAGIKRARNRKKAMIA